MKNLIHTAVVTLFAVSAAHAQQAVQWKVSDGGNGHWYQLQIPSQPPTWEQARSWAVSHGGALASIQTDSERVCVYSVATGAAKQTTYPPGWQYAAFPDTHYLGPWIGGFQLPGAQEPSGGWFWTDGSPIDLAITGCALWNICSPDANRLYLLSRNMFGVSMSNVFTSDFDERGVCNTPWSPPADGIVRSFVVEWEADLNRDGIVDYGQILSGELPDANNNGIPDCYEGFCCGDVNRDGMIDGSDLGSCLSNWGPVTNTPMSRACDLDSSGQVDGADLGLILNSWGACTGLISSISPLDGCSSGGTGITILGTFLGSTSSVTVGGVPCSDIVIRSASQVDAIVPPGTPGSAEIVLTTAGGVIRAEQSFAYAASSIASVSPSQGCVIGGTLVTITGSCLAAANAVTVGGIPCTDVTVISPAALSAVVPAGVPGLAEVRVITPNSTAIAPAAFSYLPPTVTSISPSIGRVYGGTPITITGDYLSLTTDVKIGGSSCTQLTVVNANTVTAVAPPGSVGLNDVVITGGKGTTIVPGSFRYISVLVPSWATFVEDVPDPTVVTDPALRASIIATNYAWRVKDTATQIEMMLIPPGTFQMGCIMGSNAYACRSSELPVHQVTLTNALYMGRYEVTQAQWVAKMGSNPSYFQGYSDSASRPVEQVSWNSIQNYLSVTGMRLPTEAEWEYACRAGTQTPFYNGSTDDNTLGALAWYSSNSGNQTHAVGWKSGNRFGLYDMLGNVTEWGSDWLGTYSSTQQTNPTGPSSASQRVIRGADFGSSSSWARSPARQGAPPSLSFNYLGFRVARNP